MLVSKEAQFTHVLHCLWDPALRKERNVTYKPDEANVSAKSKGLTWLSAVTVLAISAGAYVMMGGGPQQAQAQRVSDVPIAAAEMMKPGPLADIVLGKADAPVPVVEYFSMTCPHCRRFHEVVYPAFKKKYIDTGKAKLIMRAFPLNDLDSAAFMLSRCVSNDKHYDVVGALLSKQREWDVRPKNPVPALFAIGKQLGFTKATFDKCLTDQKLLDKLLAGRKRAAKVFKVNATPAVFVNGKRMRGASFAELEQLMEPLLKPKG